MERQKKEVVITGILIVLFLMLLVSAISRKGKKAETKTAVPVSPATGPIEQGVITADIKKPKEIQWGRDPFVLTPYRTAEGGAFVLSAILWDEENPYAIINDEVVNAGQEINGYKVVKINKENVIIKQGDKEIVLELYK